MRFVLFTSLLLTSAFGCSGGEASDAKRLILQEYEDTFIELMKENIVGMEEAHQEAKKTAKSREDQVRIFRPHFERKREARETRSEQRQV